MYVERKQFVHDNYLPFYSTLHAFPLPLCSLPLKSDIDYSFHATLLQSHPGIRYEENIGQTVTEYPDSSLQSLHQFPSTRSLQSSSFYLTLCKFLRQ